MQRQKDSVNLMTFIKPHQSGFLLSIILAVISVTSGIVPYFAVARIVNLLIGGETNFSAYLTWGIVALIAYLMKSVFHGLSTRCSHEATFHVLSEIRQAIADKLTRVSMGYLTDTPSGRLKTTMVERVEQMEVPLAHIIPEMTSNLLVPIAIIIYLFVLDWRMALVSLITIPIGMLCYMAQMKEYPKKYGAVVQASKYMSATTVEYINGIEVIKAFNRSAASYGKYADSVRYFHDSTMAWWSQCWLWNAAARAVLPSTLLGTLPVGAWLYMEGSLSLPVFLVALVVPLGFIAPLMKVSEAMEQVSMIKGNLEQVTAFLKTPELVRPTKPAELGERRYQFEDVHFAYNEAEVLHGISFQTQPGTMTAIVGPSGSGKSTIAKLMAGFWDVTSGTVRFGGQDIRNIPFGQLMDEISYVAQDNFLFDCSLKENIRLGRPGASDEEVLAAAQAAQCEEFIGRLEHGWDTTAGDAGKQLSGGERQRAAMARALVTEPACVLADEPTGNLDVATGEAVIELMFSLNAESGTTLVLVTHDNALAARCGRTLRLASGRLVEG